MFYDIPLPLQDAVKLEIKLMVDCGVITLITKPTRWCAGNKVVPKNIGKVRLCVDYMHLNKSVLRNRHKLPTINKVLDKLAGTKVFSALDANSHFWQILLEKISKVLTTFVSPQGRFCFNRLQLGVSSTLEFFQ